MSADKKQVKKSIEELCKQPVDPETYDDSWAKQLPDFAKECNYNPDAKDDDAEDTQEQEESD